MKDWVSGEEINHQYDELGRLIASATTGPQWGLSWTYDGFGNRLAQNVTKGTAPVVSLSISAAVVPRSAQDAAGDLARWPGVRKSYAEPGFFALKSSNPSHKHGKFGCVLNRATTLAHQACEA
jgi:YD repeat-containing protein